MKIIRRVAGGTALLTMMSLLLVLFSPQSSTASTPVTRSARSSGTSPDSNTRRQTAASFIVSEAVSPTISMPARDLPAAELEIHLDREINPRFGLDSGNSELRIPGGRDPLLDIQESVPRGSALPFQTPIINIDGQGFTGVNPPDTVGDVGPNHYVQSINGGGGAIVQVYDKTGVPMGTQFSMSGLGTGNCGSNPAGDPIILYDRLADRWFLQEFTAPGVNTLCIYISQTPDPLGAYFAYEFAGADGFPDYPHFGVWPDAYYGSSNDGGSPSQYAFDRVTMLAGGAATYQSFTTALPDLSGFGFENAQPADLDGPVAPPVGSPGIIMRHVDSEAHGNPGGADVVEIWEYDVDFATPANSTLTLAQSVALSEFDSDLCGLTSFNCFQQPGTGTTLDPLREVIMHRLQYRNDVGQQTLVGTLVTDVSGSDQGGKRWFVLEKTGGSWVLADEGTFAPDGDSRFMGSISMDKEGNIALAYNVSSSATFPSLRYTGRLASDPPGTMPQGENVIINGSASNASNRYGDYSSMNVDPADDCTFWFTGEYNTASTWSTRIATFQFEECLVTGFTVSPDPVDIEICEGEDAVYTVASNPTNGFIGNVTLGTTGAPGTPTFSANPITPPATSDLTISGATAGTYSFDITGTSGITTETTTVNLVVQAGVPATPVLVAPANGATGVGTSPMFTWVALASALSYDIEIATDSAFTNIIDSASGLISTSYNGSGLSPETTYYWRVRANNGCGAGEWMSASFTTANIACSIPVSAIGGGTITDTISLTTGSAQPLTDLDVALDISHTWVGDLTVTLEHVNTGTTVILIDQPGVPALSTDGCSDDNVFGTADDSGVISPIENHCPGTTPWLATTDTFVPEQPLDSFVGEDFSGDWTLSVTDGFAGADDGTLNEWCLIPTSDPLAIDMQTAVVEQPASQAPVWLVISLTSLMLMSAAVFVLTREEQ